MTRVTPAVLVNRLWRRLQPSRSDLVVLAVASLFLALITFDVVAGGLLTYFDEAVRQALPSSTEAPTWTRAVGLLGNIGVGGAVVLVVALVVMHTTWRWWPGVLAMGQLGAASLVVVALKYAVARPGPSPEVPPDGYPGFYPSGHTATATVSVGIVVFLLSSWRGPVSQARRRGLYAGGTAGLLVGASTVLGGFHWMSDVVASLAIAAAVLVVGFGMAESYVTGHHRRSGSDSR